MRILTGLGSVNLKKELEFIEIDIPRYLIHKILRGEGRITFWIPHVKLILCMAICGLIMNRKYRSNKISAQYQMVLTFQESSTQSPITLTPRFHEFMTWIPSLI